MGGRPKRGKQQLKRLQYTPPKNVCDFNLVMISSLASKWQVLKVGMPIFQPLYEVKLKASYSRLWNKRSPLNKRSPWNIWEKQ